MVNFTYKYKIYEDKDFKHEIKDQKLRRFYITAALNLI